MGGRILILQFAPAKKKKKYNNHKRGLEEFVFLFDCPRKKKEKTNKKNPFFFRCYFVIADRSEYIPFLILINLIPRLFQALSFLLLTTG